MNTNEYSSRLIGKTKAKEEKEKRKLLMIHASDYYSASLSIHYTDGKTNV